MRSHPRFEKNLKLSRFWNEFVSPQPAWYCHVLTAIVKASRMPVAISAGSEKHLKRVLFGNARSRMRFFLLTSLMFFPEKIGAGFPSHGVKNNTES